MKVPEDFEPISQIFIEDNHAEFLEWKTLDSSKKFYPEFFKTELLQPEPVVKHCITDGR